MLDKGFVFVNEPVKDICEKSWDKSISVRTTYYLQSSKSDNSMYSNDSLSIPEYSKNIAKVVEIIKNCTNSDKVNIIAHSMGGLVARKFIVDNGIDSVNFFITLGTPHKGISKGMRTACNFGRREQAGAIGDTECEDMWENSDFIRDINKVNIPESIKLFTIGGTKHIALLSLLNSGENDGIVSVNSAHLDSAIKYNVNCDHSELINTSCESYFIVKSILEGNPPSNVKKESLPPVIEKTIKNKEVPTKKSSEPLIQKTSTKSPTKQTTEINKDTEDKTDNSQISQEQKSKEKSEPPPKKEPNPISKLFSRLFNFFQK